VITGVDRLRLVGTIPAAAIAVYKAISWGLSAYIMAEKERRNVNLTLDTFSWNRLYVSYDFFLQITVVCM